MLKTLLFFVAGAALCNGANISEIDARVGPRLAISTLRYQVYTKENHREAVNLDLEKIEDSLVLGREVVILVHGIQGHESGISTFNTVLKDAFLTGYPDLNIITMDWSVYASLGYATATVFVPTIAENLVNVITKLVDYDGEAETSPDDLFSLSKIHLVGFDVGAHLVGIAGRSLGGEVARITALDPARTNWGIGSERLRESDAQYVEVIHTDIGTAAAALGIIESIGTADFYPNGGVTQPGCTNNLCNHDRAWELFAASLSHVELSGNRCLTMAQMTSNICTMGPVFHMGNNELDKFAWDIIRINTGKIYPYAV